ncbi:MAG: nuclease-related domain-containing protein [Chloroflexota bacterium]
MRVETNDRIMRRNRKIAQYSFFISMGVWLAGLGVSFSGVFGDDASETLSLIEVGVTLTLPFALILALFAVYMTNLWIREPRPEQAIRDGLKGVSNKSVLYHYFHAPAKHVLISPQGVIVMIVRWQPGTMTVDGEKWRMERGVFGRMTGIFRLDGLGDPVGEAERAVEYIERILEPIAPDVDVEPLIVLTDPRAEADMTDSPIPVLYTDEKRKPNLKSFMRKHPDKGGELPLTDEQIEAFEKATLPE